MPSRATAAALGAAILLGAAAPAYAATDPAGAPSSVQFSTARGDAPLVHPGLHQTTAPTGDTERYAALKRPKGGAVAVAIFGSVDAEITTTDGNTTCSSSSVSLSNDVTGYTFVYVDASQSERQSYQSDDCKNATDLILKLKADDSSSSSSSSSPAASGPLQFAVTVEPQLDDVGSPAPKSQQDEIKAPSKSVHEGERALSDQLFAPTSLTPGSYKVSLTPGKLAVARVRVGWGQRLAASVDAPRNGSNFAPPQSLNLAIAAFSPQWAPVGGGTGSELLFKESSSEETADTYTAPVDTGNRKLTYGDAGDVGASEARWTTVAGWYYVVVRVSASDEGDKLTTEKLPARLNLSVVGSPTEGPSYVGADGKAAVAPPATQLSQGGHSDSGSSTGTVLRVVGSLFVIAVAAGVVALLLRRRQS
ncbi:hypothetical protein GCM10011492_31580 [Flexivirga endophytica]|uniref:Peptidase n=2 Tax=Flexivirga endophytica TaxID=1849103 RepID=A0A916TCL2_9MICO|nr:hypothetical protein GCM10011492_31580 [Flexivirga endophytica]GHB46503.1 hypothetical protein GCM10008112_13970 [Flexivirga endophytica]